MNDTPLHRPRRSLLVTAVMIVAFLVASALGSGLRVESASALANGLARTPPMGWNNWYLTGCNVTASLVKSTAATMAAKDAVTGLSLVDLGYTYVNVDDCWSAPNREAGDLAADPKKFPAGADGTPGIRVVADYVHGLDPRLKLGIYADAGTKTCAGLPGSSKNEARDVNTFAAWGVDFVKVDWCNTTGLDPKTQYTIWRDAIAASGRPMVFSICNWGVNQPWLWGPETGNMWRTAGDIPDRWLGFLSVVDKNEPLARYAGPGAWNDPDILQVGRSGMTDVEYRSQFSLWAIMAAPLLAGNDIRTMSAYTRQTLTNRDVIAVDQDPRGVQGRVVWKNPSNDLQVWAKPLARQPDGSYARAVVLFNRMYNKKDITVTWADLGLTAGTITAVRDLWSGQDVPLQTSQNRTGYTQTGYTTSVVQHGVVVLKVVATQQPPCSPGTGTAWLLC